MTFMKYLNKRGGRIILSDVKRPEKNDWGTAEEAMQTALHLEKDVNGVRQFYIILMFKIKFIDFYQSLLEIHSIAAGHNDANFCDFLETEYLQEQVDAIKEISDHVTNLKRVGEGLGVYMFDKQLSKQEG